MNKINSLKKKIKYRSEYRGIKEMDILLSKFVNKYIDTFNYDDLNKLYEILKKDDDEIFKDIFPKKFKKPLTYASWSSTTDISLAIKNEPYNSEGIDSDIDIKMFAD